MGADSSLIWGLAKSQGLGVWGCREAYLGVFHLGCRAAPLNGAPQGDIFPLVPSLSDGTTLASHPFLPPEQLSLRVKALKRQVDEAEEEIERLEAARKKALRELEEQHENNEQLQGRVKALEKDLW